LAIRILGLNKLSRLELALRDRVRCRGSMSIATSGIMRQHNERVEASTPIRRRQRRRDQISAGRAGTRSTSG
jgi:hypothetical protein